MRASSIHTLFFFQAGLFSQTCKLDRLSIGCVCLADDIHSFIDKKAQDKLECLSFIHQGYVMLSPQSREIQTKRKVHTLEIYTPLAWKCMSRFFAMFSVDILVIGCPLIHSYPQEDPLIIDVGNAHLVSDIWVFVHIVIMLHKNISMI